MANASSAAGGEFGRLLRTARCNAKLTQDALAARTGLGQSTLSAYENGQPPDGPGIRALIALAEALDLDLDELIEPFRRSRPRRPLKAAS